MNHEHKRPPHGDQWHDLRDARGRLWARYDPRRRVLWLREGNKEVTFDLTLYKGP